MRKHLLLSVHAIVLIHFFQVEYESSLVMANRELDEETTEDIASIIPTWRPHTHSQWLLLNMVVEFKDMKCRDVLYILLHEI